MNNYPIWWDTTITIYNKFEDNQTSLIKWYRQVIPNCFWKAEGNKITIGNTTLETDNTICRIPENEKFLDKYLWITKPNDLMGNFFTLGVGDIIVKGEVTDEINEYKQGYRSSDLLAKYKDLQGCIIVEKVANNTGIGRALPHYYVSGV